MAQGLEIDSDEIKRLTNHIWTKQENNRIYTVINRDKLYIYRYILGLSRGDGKLVDHVDGNVLNNKKSNLRIVDHRINAVNRSRGKGYSYDKTTGFFRVRIKVDGMTINIASTKDEEEAKNIAHETNLKYYGNGNHGNR